jgi:hypothetical protein
VGEPLDDLQRSSERNAEELAGIRGLLQTAVAKLQSLKQPKESAKKPAHGDSDGAFAGLGQAFKRLLPQLSNALGDIKHVAGTAHSAVTSILGGSQPDKPGRSPLADAAKAAADFVQKPPQAPPIQAPPVQFPPLPHGHPAAAPQPQAKQPAAPSLSLDAKQVGDRVGKAVSDALKKLQNLKLFRGLEAIKPRPAQAPQAAPPAAPARKTPPPLPKKAVDPKAPKQSAVPNLSIDTKSVTSKLSKSVGDALKKFKGLKDQNLGSVVKGLSKFKPGGAGGGLGRFLSSKLGAGRAAAGAAEGAGAAAGGEAVAGGAAMAGGEAAAGAGEAALAGGALAALTNPVTALAAGVTAAVAAVAAAPVIFEKLGESVLNLSRDLAKASGPIKAIFARSDAQDLRRNNRIGAQTAGTTGALANALQDLKSNLEPMQVFFKNAGNLIMTACVKVINVIAKVLNGIFTLLGNILKAIIDGIKFISFGLLDLSDLLKEKPRNTLPATKFFSDVAAGKLKSPARRKPIGAK